MARKFTHISTLLQYLHLSLTCMCEAWEDILMQMDLRLTKFVQEKNTSTQVQDEFLELLLWGQSRWDRITVFFCCLDLQCLECPVDGSNTS